MNQAQIINWLSQHGITDYEITEDLLVHVHGDLNLRAQKLSSIPFQLGRVNTLILDHNEFTSLERVGLPREVTTLYMSHNHLQSLEGCPKTLNLNVDNNQLESLSGLSQSVLNLSARHNKIKNLDAFLDFDSNHVFYDLNLAYNPLLCLEHFPLSNRVDLSHCQIRDEQLEYMRTDDVDLSFNYLKNPQFHIPMEFLSLQNNAIETIKLHQVHQLDISIECVEELLIYQNIKLSDTIRIAEQGQFRTYSPKDFQSLIETLKLKNRLEEKLISQGIQAKNKI